MFEAHSRLTTTGTFRTTIGVLLGICLLLSGSLIQAQVDTAKLTEIAPAIVQITCFDRNDQEVSTGSGTIISSARVDESDGIIYTNSHVIEGCSKIWAFAC